MRAIQHPSNFTPTGDPAYHCLTCGTKWYRQSDGFYPVFPADGSHVGCSSLMVPYVLSPLDTADEQALRDPHD